MGLSAASVVAWALVSGATAQATCSRGPDADGDGLSDQCELDLAARFAPVLVVSAAACNWEPETERLGGAYLFGVHPTANGLRLVYLPAYFMDCGWSGAKCLLRWRGGCDPHDGDSELIAVDIVPGAFGQGWELDRVFLSAHCFGGSDGDCRWFARNELQRFGDAVLVWVAEGKNANYRTKSACDSGHWHFDTCDRNDVTVRYPIRSVLQNIGSRQAPFPHHRDEPGCVVAAELPFVAGRPGRECLWTDDRFHGWSDGLGKGSTGYRRYLESVADFGVVR